MKALLVWPALKLTMAPPAYPTRPRTEASQFPKLAPPVLVTVPSAVTVVLLSATKGTVPLVGVAPKWKLPMQAPTSRKLVSAYSALLIVTVTVRSTVLPFR
jgi:hypothetical protein